MLVFLVPPLFDITDWGMPLMGSGGVAAESMLSVSSAARVSVVVSVWRFSWMLSGVSMLGVRFVEENAAGSKVSDVVLLNRDEDAWLVCSGSDGDTPQSSGEI